MPMPSPNNNGVARVCRVEAGEVSFFIIRRASKRSSHTLRTNVSRRIAMSTTSTMTATTEPDSSKSAPAPPKPQSNETLMSEFNKLRFLSQSWVHLTAGNFSAAPPAVRYVLLRKHDKRRSTTVGIEIPEYLKRSRRHSQRCTSFRSLSCVRWR